jgi:hypothetical protein
MQYRIECRAENMYEGERCSMVICPAFSAIAGFSNAVAPLPITTICFPL